MERGEAGGPSGGGPEEKREGEIVCMGPRPAEFKPTEDTTLDKKEEEERDPVVAPPEQEEHPEPQLEETTKEDEDVHDHEEQEPVKPVENHGDPEEPGEGELHVQPEHTFDLQRLLSGVARAKKTNNEEGLMVDEDIVISKEPVKAKDAKGPVFDAARQKEIQAWRTKKVMTTVENQNYHTIDTT